MDNSKVNLLNNPIFWVNIVVLFVALVKYTLKYCFRFCRYKHLSLCWSCINIERDQNLDLITDKLRIENDLESNSTNSKEKDSPPMNFPTLTSAKI